MRRDIGALLGVALIVNATIGTGIFKTPAKVARLAGSTGASLAVWVAGSVIALCGALTLAELAASLPRMGGIYEYLRRAWGDRVAFVFGWAKLTLLIPSAVGSFAKLGAEAATSLLGLATDGLFVRWLGALSPRTAGPSRAVVVAALLGAGYVLARSFEQLTEAFVVGYFPFYVLAVLAVFRLRAKEPGLARPFSVPLYPLPPLVFLAGAGVLLWGASRDVDHNAAIAFAVVLAGVPVGWIWRRLRG
ncbi:MAG: amino acid permease [Myxococcaceae bacterium]|nr:MAG: amino acid permease [Myxococcaceae bacterium]